MSTAKRQEDPSASVSNPVPPSDSSPEHSNVEISSRNAEGDTDVASPVAQMAWAFAELLIEVKDSKYKAPFSTRVIKDPAYRSAMPASQDRMLARGRTTRYWVEIFNHQHRQHMFVVSIICNMASLIYLDQSGAVYTQPFDYVEEPVALATFLYRFTKMSPEERGHDPTTSLASESERDVFRELWRTYPDSAIGRRNPAPILALKHAGTPGWPVYALSIYASWSDESKSLSTDRPFTLRRCFVGRPHYMSGSLTGRGTRGLVAYDLVDERVMYIKDSWRAISEDVSSEYDNYRRIYGRLAALNAPFHEVGLLAVLAGGDVQPTPEPTAADRCTTATLQNTRAQEVLNDGLSTAPLMRRHQRLVFKEVCRPLEDFKDAHELCDVLLHALCAHSLAWGQADIMHRDVSASNILICDTVDGPRGVLADWDLAKPKNLLSNQKATQPSGTWQFLSALRQCFPETPWQLSDDLESFMHVLNWIALKYLKHESTYEDERIKTQCRWFHDVYDARAPEEATVKMDERHIKLNYIVAGKPFVTVCPLRPDNPLNILLRSLAQLFQEHYQSDEIQTIWRTPPPQPSPTLEPVTLAAPVGPTNLNVLSLVYENLGLSPFPSAGTTTRAPPRKTKKQPKATTPLTNHTPIIRLFHAALVTPKWWSNIEKTSNQVPSW
ncbi:hypothetical protein C8Q79DRAFT_899953 [Trametes meyenii]|nr:hypothetical protein C8Q79DRAFT_899953 [Trametes meyenii]